MKTLNIPLIDFITKTNNIKGCSFATIKNYTNSHGEVANHKINLGASLQSAKAKDLKALKELDIIEFAKTSKFSLELLQKAYINVYNSLVKIGNKKYDGTIKEKSNRSYAQTNAYTVINNSLKIHNDFERLYIYALRINKEVLIKGVYPIVKSRDLTLAQNEIKKGMLHTNFTTYIVEKADVMNLAKTRFNGNDLTINL